MRSKRRVGVGKIQLNGAAARLGAVGDRVIIITYADYEEAELAGFAPKIVFVDDQNRQVFPETPKIQRAV